MSGENMSDKKPIPPTALTPATIEKVAALARVSLSPEEVQIFAVQLTSIIGAFNEISTIPTENILPLLTPSEIPGFLREDVVQEFLGTEEALAAAPERVGRLFKVPPVV